LLLGHNPPAVVAAVAEQLTKGTHFGACHAGEVAWAEQVCRLMPGLARLRFTSSGTEATLLAVRLARAYTGKKVLVRFAGHFHGWHDQMAFGVGSHFDGSPTPGVLAELAAQVLLLPPGDESALKAAFATRTDLAAVIVEPTGGSWGQVPLAPRYLQLLRDVTQAHGVVLILDEVISGFRCAPGGAQHALSIQGDLVTLAKILAGGLPGGAVGGRREIMDLLDSQTSAAAGREKIGHQGTFNASPLSAAAGLATLKEVESGGVCERANAYAAKLRAELAHCVRAAGLPWVVYGSFSGFHLFLNPERRPLTAEQIESGQVPYQVLKAQGTRPLAQRLRLAMLVEGVDLFGWPGGPTSAAHTEADLEQTAAAFERAIGRLKADRDV